MIKRIVLLFICLGMVFSLIGCQEKEEPTYIKDKPEPEPVIENTDNNSLVVYFSVTGNTKRVGDMVASLTGSDTYEIIVAEPYTEEDLDYHNKESRTSIEQNDPEIRVDIKSEDIDLNRYDTIYLGYPIWHSQAPRVMSTFVEKYDFNDIKVIPFCTSGSSDIGESDDALCALAGSGNWIQGKRFSGNAEKSEIENWIREIQ